MAVESVLHLIVAPSPIRPPSPLQRAAADFHVAPNTLELLARKKDQLLPQPLFPGRGRRLDIQI